MMGLTCNDPEIRHMFILFLLLGPYCLLIIYISISIGT